MSNSLWDSVEALESFSVILGVIFIFFQIRQQTKIAQADHDRQKKQSTIEFYYSNFNESYRLPDDIDKGLETSSIESINIMPEKSIRKYLTFMEHFAVGINSDVYDFNIFDKMMGNALSRRYRQFDDYIKKSRIKDEHPIKYIEFEKLIRNIIEHRKAHPDETIDDSIRVRRP